MNPVGTSMIFTDVLQTHGKITAWAMRQNIAGVWRKKACRMLESSTR
jgi:hypothetical protein